MTAKRGTRRVVQDWLKSIGREQRYLAKVWSQPQTTYDPDAEDAKLGFAGGWRPLKDAEKVENQAQRWLELYRTADRMSAEALELKNFAAMQWQVLTSHERPATPVGEPGATGDHK